MMKIAIAGATGRMGKMLIETVLNTSDAQLVGALEHSACPQLGGDAGAFLGKKTGVLISADVAAVLANAEYLIDFTRPEGTMAHLAAAEKTGTKMIIGTTGLTSDQIANLKKASANLAIVWGSTLCLWFRSTLTMIHAQAFMMLPKLGYPQMVSWSRFWLGMTMNGVIQSKCSMQPKR
jgi:4-hydroxy-tetrahydrodipicolinate reductase